MVLFTLSAFEQKYHQVKSSKKKEKINITVAVFASFSELSFTKLLI